MSFCLFLFTGQTNLNRLSLYHVFQILFQTRVRFPPSPLSCIIFDIQETALLFFLGRFFDLKKGRHDCQPKGTGKRERESLLWQWEEPHLVVDRLCCMIFAGSKCDFEITITVEVNSGFVFKGGHFCPSSNFEDV